MAKRKPIYKKLPRKSSKWEDRKRERGVYTPLPMPKDEDIDAVLAQIRQNRLTVPRREP